MRDEDEIADIYQEMLEEKRGHGDNSGMIDMLKDATKRGLIEVVDTKKGWMVRSKVTPDQELIHRGEKSMHYLRRFLQKIQK